MAERWAWAYELEHMGYRDRGKSWAFCTLLFNIQLCERNNNGSIKWTILGVCLFVEKAIYKWNRTKVTMEENSMLWMLELCTNSICQMWHGWRGYCIAAGVRSLSHHMRTYKSWRGLAFPFSLILLTPIGVWQVRTTVMNCYAFVF